MTTGGPPVGRRPPMDARIRERRVAVSRQEGRRRLRVLIGVVTVVALAGTGVGLTRTPLLDVDRVEVVGAERTTRAAVVAAGRLAGGPLMVSIDTATVARRVESLPWVLDARATRRWPGTVHIEVTERRPVAVAPVAGGRRWAVLDATGRVLSVEAAKPSRLVSLGGLAPPGAPGTVLGPAAVPLLEVAASIPPGVAARVTDVAASGSGPGVELALAAPGGGPGGVVRLGEPTELADKFVALRALLDRAVLDDAAIVDVRVPSAPVLTRR